MIVVDASAVVDYILGSTRSVRIGDVLARADEIHAPELMTVEVVSAIVRLTRRGQIPAERANLALTHLAQLAAVRHRHDPLMARAMVLSARFSTYDAVYVALAEVLQATLLTRDTRLARQAESLVDVELIS